MNSPMPPGLVAFLNGASERPSYDQRGLPEAQVMRLREVLTLYREPNRFRVGELLQPRRGLSTMGPGPYLVVEVLPEPTTPSFGQGACCSDERFDMRVAVVLPKGDIGMAWASGIRFEPWTGSDSDNGTAGPIPAGTAAP